MKETPKSKSQGSPQRSEGRARSASPTGEGFKRAGINIDQLKRLPKFLVAASGRARRNKLPNRLRLCAP